jgi:hypothetical protein
VKSAASWPNEWSMTDDSGVGPAPSETVALWGATRRLDGS